MTEEEVERERFRAAALHSALCQMARMLSQGRTAREVGGEFTCMEADALAEVMVMSGHPREASRFLLGHSHNDDEEDKDLHYGLDKKSSGLYVVLRWGAVMA